MGIVKNINNYRIISLTKNIAKDNISDILKIINQIPLVDYDKEQILADGKGDRLFYGKWEHSLIMFDDSRPIGVILGYERKNENTQQYPINSIYISELGISIDYQNQGLGRILVQTFLDYNKEIGFKYLDGQLCFSVQTNFAEFNKHVIDLYTSFGFKQRSLKQYDNRLDTVLGLD